MLSICVYGTVQVYGRLTAPRLSISASKLFPNSSIASHDSVTLVSGLKRPVHESN